MERLVLRTARRHTYRRLAGCIGAVCAGAALVSVELTPWLGWGIVLIAGVPALILLRSLGEETERIVIDDAGIRDSHLPMGVISWTGIKGAAVQSIGGTKVVSLELREPERVLRRLPPARQFIARKAPHDSEVSLKRRSGGHDERQRGWRTEASRYRPRARGSTPMRRLSWLPLICAASSDPDKSSGARRASPRT
jgi:hypothetical protein